MRTVILSEAKDLLWNVILSEAKDLLLLLQKRKADSSGCALRMTPMTVRHG